MKINGKEYALYCDINVLEKLQEEFGTVAEFERKLIGARIDEESGERTSVEPSYRAIRIGAYLMANEAIEIANEDAEEKTAKISMEDIGRNQLRGMIPEIHQAFSNCFELKNE